MATRLLLDTNAVSAGMRADTAAVAMLTDSDAVYLSSVTLGELYYGAYHATAAVTQIARVKRLESENEVLILDPATAQVYGRIKADLRRKGRMIPDNDLWIAALALQHDLVLMTHDNHFSDVEGLAVASW